MQYKNLKNIKAENQRKRQSERLKNDITRRLLNYLERKYEMRFNTALGCTEIRKAGSNEPFVPADERMRNTIAIKARLDGIDVWDKDIRRYTESDFVKTFDPVDDFLNSLRGRWDGKDYIKALADCVPNDNGWGWTSRMVTVRHRCSSPDRVIGSLPSADAFYQKRCSGDIMTTLSSVRNRIRCGQ